jgi:hypothetical protein
MWPFKKKSKSIKQLDQTSKVEHAVIINTGSPNVTIEQVYELSDSLRDDLAGQDCGELDGHEMAVSGSDAIFYLYGPDARKLYLKIQDTLRVHEITQTGNVYLRFGDVSDADAFEMRFNVRGGLPDVH